MYYEAASVLRTSQEQAGHPIARTLILLCNRVPWGYYKTSSLSLLDGTSRNHSLHHHVNAMHALSINYRDCAMYAPLLLLRFGLPGC